MSDRPGQTPPAERWLPDPSPWGNTFITPQQVNAAREAESARVWAAIEGRQKREAEEQRAKERREQEQGRAELDAYETEAQAAWLASGGDATGFARNWPKLRDEHLAERARERLTGRERDIEARVEKARASGAYSRF
jgi:hypothetical protein